MDVIAVAPIFLAVALSSWAAVGVARCCALHWGVMDTPNERSSHMEPVPLGGGVALVAVIVAAWLMLPLIHSSVTYTHALVFISGILLIGGVSLIDDLGHVPFPVRLAVQSVAAMLIVLGYGYWSTISAPGLGTFSIGVWGVPLTMLWIVGLTNAYNFMDGIDGMAAGQAVAAGIGWMVFGAFIGRPVITTLGALLAASSLGFLVHNWHPAKIFMGDVGATVLGFSFAVLPIGASQSAGPKMVLVGVLLVWPAIFDSTFTVLRRLIRGENIFAGHRTFLFHRLVASGWSHRNASTLYLLLPLLGAALAFTWEWGTRPLHVAVAVLTIGACMGLWLLVRNEERKFASAAAATLHAIESILPAGAAASLENLVERFSGPERRAGRDRRQRQEPWPYPERRQGRDRRVDSAQLAPALDSQDLSA